MVCGLEANIIKVWLCASSCVILAGNDPIPAVSGQNFTDQIRSETKVNLQLDHLGLSFCGTSDVARKSHKE